MNKGCFEVRYFYIWSMLLWSDSFIHQLFLVWLTELEWVRAPWTQRRIRLHQFSQIRKQAQKTTIAEQWWRGPRRNLPRHRGNIARIYSFIQPQEMEVSGNQGIETGHSRFTDPCCLQNTEPSNSRISLGLFLLCIWSERPDHTNDGGFRASHLPGLRGAMQSCAGSSEWGGGCRRALPVWTGKLSEAESCSNLSSLLAEIIGNFLSSLETLKSQFLCFLKKKKKAQKTNQQNPENSICKEIGFIYTKETANTTWSALCITCGLFSD